MAAGEERLAVLDADLGQAIGAADLLLGVAVVVAHLVLVAVLAHLDADMAQPVELRAGLADLGGEDTRRDRRACWRRTGRRSASRGCAGEGALAELGHARFVDAADAVDLAVLDPLHGVEDLGWRDPVGGAGNIVLAPLGMRPQRPCRQRRRLRHLLGLRGARDQGAGGDSAADQTGGQERTTIFIDVLRRLLEFFLVMKISRVHGRSLRLVVDGRSVLPSPAGVKMHGCIPL